MKNIPQFIMMIGLPGSGKSTLAKEIAKNINGQVISSDEIRKEIFGDENIQDSPEKIFAEMLKKSKALLTSGTNVVYDATNITRKHRKHTLSQLPECVKTAQIVFAKYETCIYQDSQRARNVGESVIKRMLLNFQAPYYDEGWNEILIHINGEKYSEKDYNDWINCNHDNPHHNNTVLEHTLKVVDEAKKYIPAKATDFAGGMIGIILSISASLHDIGKKFTKAFKDSKGNESKIAHFYGHHNVSAYYSLAYQPLDAMEMDMREKMLIVWLVNCHMEPFFKSKYYRSLNQGHKELLDALHWCDVKGA